MLGSSLAPLSNPLYFQRNRGSIMQHLSACTQMQNHYYVPQNGILNNSLGSANGLNLQLKNRKRTSTLVLLSEKIKLNPGIAPHFSFTIENRKIQ